jgi:serine/threonine-protein kinase
LPPGHSSIASALLYLGEVRLAQDRAGDAEPLLRDAVEARRKALPEGDWQRAAAESSLGRCLVAQKRYEEAEPLLTMAYSVLTEKKASPDLARDAARALANLYAATNAGEKATEWEARAAPSSPDQRPVQARISSVQTRSVSRFVTRTAWLFVSAT